MHPVGTYVLVLMVGVGRVVVVVVTGSVDVWMFVCVQVSGNDSDLVDGVRER